MKPEFLTGNEKRFFEFMGNLNEKDKIAILSHNDSDGLCCAVIASKILGKVDYIRFMSYSPNMLKEVIAVLRKKKTNKIFIFDISLDSEAENIAEISKFGEILIIDHHKFEKDLNSEKIVFIKTETKFPASYCCYYLFSKIQKIPSWIAALGIIADRVDRYNAKNCQEVSKDFNFDECGNLWGIVNEVNLALIYFRGNEKKLYDLFMESENSQNINLKKYADVVRKEVKKILEDFEKNHDLHERLKIYFFKSKFNLSSLISTILSIQKYSDSTIIILSDYGKYIKVSARDTISRVDCVELLKRAIEGIPESNSGGHKVAAGAEIPHKYLSQFKKNLIKAYDEMKN